VEVGSAGVVTSVFKSLFHGDHWMGNPAFAQAFDSAIGQYTSLARA
jgi:hypothetical protein